MIALLFLANMIIGVHNSVSGKEVPGVLESTSLCNCESSEKNIIIFFKIISKQHFLQNTINWIQDSVEQDSSGQYNWYNSRKKLKNINLFIT